MLYFVMQLHFWLYTHRDQYSDFMWAILIGSLVGLCMGSFLV